MKGASSEGMVHLKEKEDFVVFVGDLTEAKYEEWKQDQKQQQADADANAANNDPNAAPGGKADTGDPNFVVPGFVSGKDVVYVTHKQGRQGTKDTASKAQCAAAFGSDDVRVAIKHILLNGTLTEATFSERTGSKNDSNGSMGGH